MTRRILMILLAASALAACGSDKANNSLTENNGTNNGTTASDMGTSDVATPDAATDDVSTADQGESDCLQVTADLETFKVTIADDVSIEYSAFVMPEVFGQERELSFLFERYIDSEYIGTFELGTGADDNFGNCTHCVFIRGDNPERAWFADAGTFVSNTNPYSRRVDFSVSGLRLVEVGVNPLNRESAPLLDGRCIEVADFSQAGVYPADGWSCPDEQFADNTECNCECGVMDPDCGGEIACLPGDPGCTPRPELPTANCEADQVCAFEPTRFTGVCTDTCDWQAGTGCTDPDSTCVFDFGVGDGDLCLPTDGDRIEPDTAPGEDCNQKNLQLLCNVVDGFARGYCGPNDVCRPICTMDSECTVAGETCRIFSNENNLGYCGPEPVDN